MSITAKIKSNESLTAKIKSADRIVTTSAHYGLKGDTGATGPTGPQGIQGNTGPQGIQGIQGVKGDTGSQGIQGIQGTAGGSSSHYHYLTKTNTFSGDPTGTFIGWNNATQIDSTALRISNTDQDSQDNNIFLNSVGQGDILVIQDSSNSSNYQKWEITGAPTYNSTWDNFPVTKIATGGTGTTNFANNYPVLLIILSVGAVGPQGIQGATGATGATGSQGIQGIQGVTGAAGTAGPGVAVGGATGTVLTKVSATNYDTTWTALGTAATKNVGQAAGNVLELSGTAKVTLGYFDGVAEEYVRGFIEFYAEPGNTGLLRGPVTANENRTYDLPDASGTIALTSQLPTFGSGVATALAVNVGSSGAPVVLNGAGGTPSSITLTNATGYPAATTTTAGTVPGIGGIIYSSIGNAAKLTNFLSAAKLNWLLGSNMFGVATTGTGGTTRNENYVSATTGATALSTSLIRSQGPANFAFSAGSTYNSSSAAVDFSRMLCWSFMLAGLGTETSTGTLRISFGKNSTDNTGQLARRGWQIRIEGSGASRTVFIAAHNGTTLGTEVAVTGSALNYGGYDVKPVVVITYNGTMYLYAGDAALNLTTPTASCVGAPTDATIITPYFQLEVLNGANAAAHRGDIVGISTTILK